VFPEQAGVFTGNGWRPPVTPYPVGIGFWSTGTIDAVEQQQRTYQADVTVGGEQQELALGNTEEVDVLINTLSRDDTRAATLRADEDDPALEAQVHGEYGYLLYAGDEQLVYSVGDPESPALEQASEAGFPAGSGLALDQFREVVIEFVTNEGGLPNAIRWQDAEPG